MVVDISSDIHVNILLMREKKMTIGANESSLICSYMFVEIYNLTCSGLVTEEESDEAGDTSNVSPKVLADSSNVHGLTYSAHCSPYHHHGMPIKISVILKTYILDTDKMLLFSLKILKNTKRRRSWMSMNMGGIWKCYMLRRLIWLKMSH